MTWWRGIVRAIVAMTVAACAAAVTPPASAMTPGAPVPVCVARAAAGDTPGTILREPARFTCGEAQYRLGSGDYWAVTPRLGAEDQPFHPRIRMASLWQDGLTMYVRYTDGVTEAIGATRAGLSRHLQLGAVIEFRPTHHARIDRLLFRIDGAGNTRAILSDLRLADAGDSARANVAMAALYAGFAGLALALVFYHLTLWVAMRHRFQLVYCAMVTTLVVYAAFASGAVAWLFPGIDHLSRIRVIYVCLGLACAFAIAFGRAFVGGEALSPLADRVVRAAILLAGGSGIVFALLAGPAMWLAAALYAWMFAAALVAIPVLLRGARRRGDGIFPLFALAWAAPILLAVLRTLATLHVIEPNFWLDNSTVFAMAAEALLSNLAIAHRVHLLGLERDAARAGEAAAQILADVDPLTGLLNRRAFLDGAIGRDGGQTLHILDIDHFKLVNETLGHDGGDEVLRLVSRTLRRVAPPGALVARMGGEEFAILCTARGPLDPERLLADLRATRMPFDLTVTASIGSCGGPLADERDWKRLYRAADRALFDAKKAGRDRAERAPPLPMPLAA